MAQLDWQTETDEQDAWQEPAPASRRIPAWLLTGSLLGLAVVGFLYLAFRGDWAAWRAERAVLSVVRAQDSTVSAEWLGLVPTGEPLTAAEIDFADDLQTAELTTHHTYTYQGNPLTVAQVHSLVWDESWQLNPVEWGDQLVHYTIQERFGAIVYQYDRVYATQYVRDFGVAIYQYCLLYPETTCPPRARIPLNFLNDAAELPLGRPISIRETIYLPTPALIGNPVDPASYTQLQSAYASFVMSPVIAEMTEYQCCEDAAGFEATVREQLSQIAVLSTR